MRIPANPPRVRARKDQIAGGVAGPVEDQLRRDVVQRDKDKVAFGEAWMRELKQRCVHAYSFVDKQVQIDGARPPYFFTHSSELFFNPEHCSEK